MQIVRIETTANSVLAEPIEATAAGIFMIQPKVSSADKSLVEIREFCTNVFGIVEYKSNPKSDSKYTYVGFKIPI